MGNTVGSREVLPIVLQSKKKQILELTKSEFDLLLGSVLGDGYITKLGRIQIEQGESQREYLEWKYSMLSRITSSKILVAERRRSIGKKTFSFRFWTKQYFHSWRNYFYPYGEKIIPSEVGTILSPLALAVWFMDDGFLRKDNAVAIATEKFPLENLEEMCQVLLNCYGIETNIVKRGRIYFGKVATQRFAEIISPFVIPTMRYKLP